MWYILYCNSCIAIRTLYSSWAYHTNPIRYKSWYRLSNTIRQLLCYQNLLSEYTVTVNMSDKKLSIKSLFTNLRSSRWFNSLWPNAAVWQQWSRSTLAQVMACCLTAPSHYLNQCWLLISKILWYSPDSNFTEKTSDIYLWNEFEIY